MNRAYLDQMQAHVDEGGQLTHRNAVELLAKAKSALSVLDAVSADVCSYTCPSTWRTGEPQPHSDLCNAVQRELGNQPAQEQ